MVGAATLKRPAPWPGCRGARHESPYKAGAMRAKLMPTPAQEALLRVHAGQARFVYNLAVDQHQNYGQGGRKSAPSFAEQSRQLTELRGETDWLRYGSAVVQQQALRDFWRGMSSFFARRARKPVRRRKWENTFNVVGKSCGLATVDRPIIRSYHS